MLDELVGWIEANPAIRRALPWVSGALIAIGVVVIVTSLSGGGGGTEEPVQAQPTATADLERAADAAREYLRERVPPTYEGFNVSTAEGMEPELTWVKEDPEGPGEVQIRVAKSNNLLLIAMDGPDVYCLALDIRGEATTGKVDAAKTAECDGGW